MGETSVMLTENVAVARTVTISALSRRSVQCVGPWFLSHYQGRTGGPKIDLSSAIEDGALVVDADGPSATVFDPDDVEMLRKLDPKQWKTQDHYAVLGIKKLRYKATEEDIKKAYRMKVLLHHPDKRKAAGEDVRPDDDYFTCIIKAYEILGNPQKRRSYDSVDLAFPNPAPPTNENTKKNFFQVFDKVFALEARFSEKVPVPELGGPDDTRENVEKFYAFWYSFESWREFSYLDEDDKERGQIREERKWIEKQNKFYRAKRKKEDTARLRSLVDTAYNLDPRIAKFKLEDKERKEAIKQAKRQAAKARQEEEERKHQKAEEEERDRRAKLEAVEKTKQDALKAVRDAHKKAIKMQRTALRKLVKANDYYIEKEDERVRHMASLEKLCDVLKLELFNEVIEDIASNGRTAFLKAVGEMEKKIEEERQANLAISQSHTGAGTQTSKKGGQATWTNEELHLLIKAVNLFPAGTNQRWEIVANFINQHDTSSCTKKTSKEVLMKAKSLQGSDFSKNILKETVHKQAYNIFEKEPGSTVKSAAVTDKTEVSTKEKSEPQWTASEQTLLEQALKTYPASTLNRWDKIAECIPTRTKKQCVLRYKEIAEMVKAKKAAQAVAEQKKK